MLNNRAIGWAAVGLFALAVIGMVLLAVATVFELSGLPDPRVGVGMAGLLALVAAALGFAAFQTVQGRLAAIGGLSLLIGILMQLSLTAITRVERTDSFRPDTGWEHAMKPPPV
jgi:hypothetical protein